MTNIMLTTNASSSASQPAVSASRNAQAGCDTSQANASHSMVGTRTTSQSTMRMAGAVVDHGNEAAVIAARISRVRHRTTRPRHASRHPWRAAGAAWSFNMPDMTGMTKDPVRGLLRSDQILFRMRRDVQGSTGREQVARLGLMAEAFG